jgi:hypothetical protein
MPNIKQTVAPGGVLRTSYTPPTMQPARPGADAALQVPSLTNGQRTTYKPPVAQCTRLIRGSVGLAS